MRRDGVIIIVEDDEDDQELLMIMFKELKVKNQILCFSTCPPVLEYLKETSIEPFLILCDINLPKMSGIEFKKAMEADSILCKKYIPFLFFSTSDHQSTVNRAYAETSIQGFFQKRVKYEDTKVLLKMIIDYWENCLYPDSLQNTAG